MRLHHDERGQTILLVALSLPFMLGFIGMATDVGALFKDKRTIQTAADAAAIAGALNLNYGNYVTAAKDASMANGFKDGSNGVTVTIKDPPTWTSSNYKGVAGYVEATVSKSEPTIFLALFGYPSVTVLARAVASSSGPGVCVFAGVGNTPPTSTPLTVNNATEAQQCGVAVDSNNSPPIVVSGGGSLTATSVGVVGDCSGCGTPITPTPVSGIVPHSDPLASLAQATCSGGSSDLNIAGNQNPPGCYNGLAPASFNIQLQQGTYIFNGNVNLSGSGTVTGAGVTIFMGSTGALNIGPNTVMNLSAPSSGTYNGVLFTQNSSNISAASIAINPASNLQGLMYFPAGPLTIVTNSAPTQPLYTGFVANSITFTGSGSLSFQNYSAAPGVISPIPSAVLVE